MAGLLGALALGATSGYANQRVKDMERQEAFNMENALKESEFHRQALLQKMGFKQSKELESIRHGNAIATSDHNLENAYDLENFKLSEKTKADDAERARLRDVVGDAEDLETVQNNLIRNGDVDPKTIMSMKSGEKASPIMHKGHQYNPQTGEWVKVIDDDSSNANGKGDESGFSNKELRQLQGDLNKEVDTLVEGAIINQEEAPKMKKTVGSLLRFNKDSLSVGEYLDAGRKLMNQDTSKLWLQSDQGVMVNAATIDGKVVFLSNRTKTPEQMEAEIQKDNTPDAPDNETPEKEGKGLFSGLMGDENAPDGAQGFRKRNLAQGQLRRYQERKSELERIISGSTRTRGGADYKQKARQELVKINAEIQKLKNAQ